MTIDERLEKLVERHEALTQSVELMRLNQEARDKHLDFLLGQMMEGIARLSFADFNLDQRVKKLEEK